MEIMVGICLVHLFRLGGYMSARMVFPMLTFGFVRVQTRKHHEQSPDFVDPNGWPILDGPLWRWSEEGGILIEPGLSTWIGMLVLFPILLAFFLRALTSLALM